MLLETSKSHVRKACISANKLANYTFTNASVTEIAGRFVLLLTFLYVFIN
jgi:hypothetical protein